MSTSRSLFAVLLLTAGIASAQFNRPQATESTSDSGLSTQPISIASPQQQSPFLGSMTAQQATDQPLRLSISEAIERGLKNNLGLILTHQGGEAAPFRLH